MERTRAFARLKNWWLKNWRVLALCGGCLFAGFLVGLLIFRWPGHLPPAWGDIPGWITAIATAGLLIGAFFTARYAIKAFGAQSQQLKDQRKINEEQIPVLRLQARELEESLAERKREAERRHRAQASLVFITQERAPTAPAGYPETEGVEPFVTATVHNTSEQPIYDAELYWHVGTEGHGDPNPEPLGTILPKSDTSRMREFPYGVDMSNSGAVVRFTDANGTRWLRRPDGDLDQFRQA